MCVQKGLVECLTRGLRCAADKGGILKNVLLPQNPMML
jgi:hypothetical protein